MNKVLLIAPVFFSYEKKIISELEKEFSVVFFVDEIPCRKFFFILKNLLPFALKFLTTRQNKNVIDLITENNIDNLLIIRGAFLDSQLLTQVKLLRPSITIFHYQWDSVKNNPNALRLAEGADKNFSFDLSDCLKYPQFSHLPLFYSDEDIEKTKKLYPCNDLIFIGSFHLFRYEELKKIENLLENKGITFYFKMVLPFLVFIKLLIGGKYIDLKNIRFKSFTKREINKLTASSKVVFDLPSSVQNGASMRVIESLAMKKKILTTNQYIVNEAFFHPDNIQVIELQEFEVPAEFFSGKFNSCRDNQILSLSQWIQAIVKGMVNE